MLKNDAIARWGSDVVETARDYYETDFDKYLFDEDSPDGYGASDKDQIERCTRAYRNTMLEGHVHPMVSKQEQYSLPFDDMYATRRTGSHEYVYRMPVAAYRDKRKGLTPEVLEFLHGDPGWQYSEHWSTPGES